MDFIVLGVLGTKVPLFHQYYLNLCWIFRIHTFKHNETFLVILRYCVILGDFFERRNRLFVWAAEWNSWSILIKGFFLLHEHNGFLCFESLFFSGFESHFRDSKRLDIPLSLIRSLKLSSWTWNKKIYDNDVVAFISSILIILIRLIGNFMWCSAWFFSSWTNK